jgi:hypothetical protein
LVRKKDGEKIMLRDYKIWLIFAIGLALRFYGYWSQSINIDEIFLYQNLFGEHIVHSEFLLRLPFVLCGSLIIFVPILIFKKKEIVYITTVVIALFPMYVFWSRVANPYIVASLLIALSFTKWNKYFVFNFLSLLVTPFALLGFNFNPLLTRIKKIRRKPIGVCYDYDRTKNDGFEFKYPEIISYNRINFILYCLFIMVGAGLFILQPSLNIKILITDKQIWMLPFTSLIFHLGMIGERYGK